MTAHAIVQWARGMCVDREPHDAIDAKLGEALDPIYALEAENERLREALYNAHEFIESVTAWNGQMEDRAEVATEIEAVLLPASLRTEDHS